MAQDIDLLGAVYPDVPAVELPKDGGGTALFTDVSDTTAVAGDVASGKYFYTAAGVRTAGTASGGGGSIVPIALRPDATLVYSKTYDAHIVDDEGVTIPAYTTTATQLLAAQTNWATTPQLTFPTAAGTGTSFLCVWRLYAIPEYNTTAKSKGRQEYWVATYVFEYVRNSGLPTIDNSKAAAAFGTSLSTTLIRLAYWSSASAFSASSGSYGAYVYSPTAAPVTTGSNYVTMTFTRPALYIRGNSTYFTSSNWGNLTDIRYVIKLEVYSAPDSPSGLLNGWTMNQSLLQSVAEITSS